MVLIFLYSNFKSTVVPSQILCQLPVYGQNGTFTHKVAVKLVDINQPNGSLDDMA